MLPGPLRYAVGGSELGPYFYPPPGICALSVRFPPVWASVSFGPNTGLAQLRAV
jgi:hypothetical protein